jgi:hypothetical protein
MAFSACVPRPTDAPVSPDTAAPILEALEVTCDGDAPRWTIEARTRGWTTGGLLAWSVDGTYRETHPLASVSAARDGSTDRLQLTLDVAADWRDAATGSRTAFACEQPGLAAVVHIRDGDALVDCRSFGEDPARWAQWDESLACDATP